MHAVVEIFSVTQTTVPSPEPHYKHGIERTLVTLSPFASNADQ